MKKIIFLLIAILSITLTGCKWFDSPPIEPDIIGTAPVQYDAEHGIWYVTIDTVRYTITKVTINAPNIHPAPLDIDPVEGMIVTIFTSPRKNGIQAVDGTKTVENIEKMYYENHTAITIILIGLALCIICIVYAHRK
jgi:hypothetical protein